MSATIEAVAARLAEGATLSDADARALADSTDILGLGMLADEARRRRHGNQATFLRVARVRLNEDRPPIGPGGVGEVRLLVPMGISWEAACDGVKRVLDTVGSVAVSAFSLDELEVRAGAEEQPLALLLDRLRRIGLDLIAEAPIDRLQNPHAALRAANEVGLRLARSSVARTPLAESVALFRQVAALQHATGSLRSFAPLSGEPAPNQPTTGYEDVKRISLARLIIDNVETIQVDWSASGPKLAQVALTFGADDLDGVPPAGQEDRNKGPRRATLEEVRRNIEVAGMTPLERNGRFEPVGV